mgnify:CR=1 FL=1|jgi:hypothetical protein|tara:strand:- start:16 stop:333 length:318 start_codon:yes stop_codon:yes gene_type:complete
MTNSITHIAIARSGDIVGMSNPGEVETFDISDSVTFKAWRAFNRLNKQYHAAMSVFLNSGGKESHTVPEGVREDFYNAYGDMQALYGEDGFSKWHARTTWVVKKV